jgi:hypothetical protein
MIDSCASVIDDVPNARASCHPGWCFCGLPVIRDEVFEIWKVGAAMPLVVVVGVSFPVKEIFDLFVASPVIDDLVDGIFELGCVRILRRRWRCLFASCELRGSAVIRLEVFDVDDRVRFDGGGKVKLVAGCRGLPYDGERSDKLRAKLRRALGAQVRRPDIPIAK